MPRGAVRRRAVQERVDLPFDFGVEIVGHRQSVYPFAHAEREEARVQAPAPFDLRVALRLRRRRCFRKIQFAAMTFRWTSPSLATEPPHGPGAQVEGADCAGKTKETTTCNLDK
ncbi:hypothetical protein [Burkholderia sp. AU6039]|uniref:hypothetical protein n=1 Tax=Burkholderia sp. AU6039 TaxID=2015344 RepID=UPI0015C64F2D|nr:hypothetical protein [Burkholderia sp. AU6039]